MQERLIYCLCHPSKIVFFFKDKFIKPILFVLGFFLLYIGICALTSFGSDIFTSKEVDGAVNTVVRYLDSSVSSTVVFDSESKTFAGNETRFSSSSFDIIFMPTEGKKKVSSDVAVLVFMEDKAVCYYSGICAGEYKYSSLVNISSFTMDELVSGNMNARNSFRELVSALFDASEIGVSGLFTLNYSVTGLCYFASLLVFLLIISYLNNPTVGFGIRIKLCLYDTLIYFVFMCFYIGFQAEFFMYLGLFLAVYYNLITFMHIVKN